MSLQQQSQMPSTGGGDVVASDAELLLAVGGGSETAFAEFARRYRSLVERTCRAVVGSDSDDCAQEVFVRIWRKARLYDPDRGSAPGWVLTLTRSVAYSLTRKTRLTTLPIDAEPLVEDASPLDRFWIEGALAQLPPHERTALELAYFHDRSQSQIAAELSVPLGTVKSWSRRGLNRLALLLEDAER